MGSLTDLRLTVHGYGDATGDATVQVESFDRAARLRRAVGGLIACWALALVALFVPVAHLFLVPGFFLAGVALFANRMRTADLVRRGEGLCPDCGTEQDLDVSGRWTLPHRVTCAHCQRSMILRAADSRE